MDPKDERKVFGFGILAPFVGVAIGCVFMYAAVVEIAKMIRDRIRSR